MAQSVYIPFGDFRPDHRMFSNEGLTKCQNVVPVYQGYVAAPLWQDRTAILAAECRGLHIHPTLTSQGWRGYYGDATKLYFVNPLAGPPWTITDYSRLVGGAYTLAGTTYGWQGASIGDNVIMTNGVDDPQLLLPGAVNFQKLATSGSGNPGMDPKAFFAFPLKFNLFLANCTLAAGFDGLSAGANPSLVAWSANKNIRQFGSFNATPELVGAGYQELLDDLGAITGCASSVEFGIICRQNGFTRVDGPPYSFRTIATNVSTRFPNSIVVVDRDVYFWGSAGPMILHNGEGPAEALGRGRLTRTLIDNNTGFSTFALDDTVDVKHVSAGIDATNGCIVWSITTTSKGFLQEGDLQIWYNYSEDRFSFQITRGVEPETNYAWGLLYLRTRPDIGTLWMPGRDLIAVMHRVNDTAGVEEYITTPTYEDGEDAPLSRQILLERAYHQLANDTTTRIQRVRPVYSLGNATRPLSVQVTISSLSKPWDTPVVKGPYSSADSNGWIATPDTAIADFHRILTTFQGVPADLVPPGQPAVYTLQAQEYEGVEVEFVKGGRYSG